MKNDDSNKNKSRPGNKDSDRTLHQNQNQRKNDIVDLNYDYYGIGDSYLNEQPTYKGEVYFSNPPKAENRQPINTKNNFHKNRHRNEKLALVSMISIVVVFSIILSSIAISCVNDVLAINRSKDTEIITVSIPENADTNDIIKILDKSGLIKNRIFCNIFTGLFSKLKKSKTPKYLNGVYQVKKNMGLESMLNEFKSVQITTKTVKLVFPEGWSIYQIIDKIDEYKVCEADYLYAALKETKFSNPFVAQINANVNKTQEFEGYFFPDTYEFYENENANSVIRRFLANFDEKWTDAYANRAKKLEMSMEQIITIASIIQKEAANSEQMPLVSSVIHNRLDNSSTFPQLMCNSTKDYITNIVRPIIGDAEATKYLDIYNSYISQGLPPGPICNPGINAIEAALFPKETNYFYFQHDEAGQIYMARTLAEQNENTIEVLRANSKN